jgi:N-acetylmuramoyl-L-alanine amidase
MIFISAGHYPSRPGACYDDFCEHGEAVRWVNEIAGIIDTGIVIVPTGTLKQKTDFINSYDTDDESSICVEIHFNAAMAGNVHVGNGSECLYMPDSVDGKRLAEAIQSAIVSDTDFRDRGVKEGWYRMNRLNGPDYFLSKTKYPAVIIEPEFIQHRVRIQQAREATCQRIAQSIMVVHNEFNN